MASNAEAENGKPPLPLSCPDQNDAGWPSLVRSRKLKGDPPLGWETTRAAEGRYAEAGNIPPPLPVSGLEKKTPTGVAVTRGPLPRSQRANETSPRALSNPDLHRDACQTEPKSSSSSSSLKSRSHCRAHDPAAAAETQTKGWGRWGELRQCQRSPLQAGLRSSFCRSG